MSSIEFSRWNAEKLYGTERNGTVHCEANRATFTVVNMGLRMSYTLYRECTEGYLTCTLLFADDFHPRSKGSMVG